MSTVQTGGFWEYYGSIMMEEYNGLSMVESNGKVYLMYNLAYSFEDNRITILDTNTLGYVSRLISYYKPSWSTAFANRNSAMFILWYNGWSSHVSRITSYHEDRIATEGGWISYTQ